MTRLRNVRYRQWYRYMEYLLNLPIKGPLGRYKPPPSWVKGRWIK